MMLAEIFGLSRRSLENPTVSLQDSDAWDALFGSQRTDSGIKINKKKALSYSPVWLAVTLISGAIAKLPLDLYKRTDRATHSREKDHAHFAYSLVRRKANPEQSAFEFWRQMFVHCGLWNQAFAYIDQDSPGRPLGLYPLLPDRTSAQRLTAKDAFRLTKNAALARELAGTLVYVSEIGGQLKTFYPSQILHLKGITCDGMNACDLVDYAKNSIALGLRQQQFASQFFKNGARKGGTLELPLGIKKNAADQMEEGFRKVYNEDDWFKTVILRDGAKFHEGSFSARDSQMVDATESQVRDVARFYKMQPSKFGLSDSVSYSSKSEDNQAFLDDTLSDWLAMTTAECWLKLLSIAEQEDDSHYFEHNTGTLLRLDALKRYQIYEIGRRIGMFSPNDLRAKENENPREGGDTYSDTIAGAPTPGGVAVDDVPPADVDDEDPVDDEDDEENRHALRSLAMAIGLRARHKANNPRAFVRWLDEHIAQFRGQASAIDGGDKLLADIIQRLQKIAETTNADDLPGRVNQALLSFERP